MRRTLLLALLAAQAAIPAHAATHATVVVRPSRAVAVVALTDGTLARVRLPRGTAAAVGRQVDIVGRRNGFGTLVARIVRPGGKAGRFRIAGTVVGRDGTAVLVASGGAVARLVAVPLPVVGSGVRATVRLRSGVAVAERVARRGAPGRLQLAGVVSAIGSGVVAMRLPGGANVAVGSGGRDISWLKPGDPVVIDASRRGARLVLRRYALLTGRDAFVERRRGEVVGQVKSVDGATLLVARPGRADTRIALGSPADAAGARNGDTVIVDRRAAGDPTAAHVIVLGRAVPAAAPVIELRSAPPATTPATTVVIEWAARGSVARQLCSLDGAAWVTCTSPRVVTGLARGAHVVAIAAGNDAGWAPRTDVRFTVDPPPPAAPVVTITGGAPPVSYATSASFPFTVTGSAVSVLCSLDGAAWLACTSPRAASPLGVGAHVFAVTAGNAGGWNIAERRFAVIAAPAAPTLTLTQQPVASTTSTSAVFAWTTTGTLDATECRVDAGAYTACASPLALNGLALGEHTLDVRVTNAGGTGQASAGWTIVAPPPGAPTVTITSAPSGTTTATAAGIAFSTTGAGVTTTCSFDGAAAAACTSPRVYSALALGAHQVAVVATNGGGSATATAAWTIVPAPPSVTITSGPAATVTVATATITWTTTGTVTATTCSLDGGPLTACTSPASWSGLGVGAHSVVVRASNAGGATDATVAWTIEVAAPTVAISSAPPATTAATSATIAWVTSGTVTTTTCSLDGGAIAVCASPAVLTGLVTGGHLYTVKVANAGGYATASVSWSVTNAPPPPPPPANTTLPVISGVAQSRKIVTATTGTWTGNPDTFTFQWLRCTNATSVATCTAIAGASAASYTAATADIDTFLRVQVTAANAGGSVTAVSAATPKTMPS